MRRDQNNAVFRDAGRVSGMSAGVGSNLPPCEPRGSGREHDERQRQSDLEIGPEADRRPFRTSLCCDDQVGTDPSSVKLPASVELMARTSQARTGSGSVGTNGLRARTAGTLLTIKFVPPERGRAQADSAHRIAFRRLGAARGYFDRPLRTRDHDFRSPKAPKGRCCPCNDPESGESRVAGPLEFDWPRGCSNGKSKETLRGDTPVWPAL